MSTRVVELLVVQSGDWIVAVESSVVRGVTSVKSVDASILRRLAALLGAGGAATDSGQRALTLRDTDVRLGVDRVIGVRSPELGQLAGVPPYLHQMGVPAWVLGLWQVEGEKPVVIIDPVGACAGEVSSHG